MIWMLSHGQGSFQRARFFASHYVQAGHEVEIVTISKNRRWRGFTETAEDGVRVVHSPDLLWGQLRTGWDPWNTLWRKRYSNDVRPTWVECFDLRPVSVIPAFALKRRLDVPVILHWGDWWGRGGTSFERHVGVKHILDMLFSPVETFFEERYQRRADGVLVLSEALRQRAIALGAAPERVLVYRHGIDAGTLEPRVPGEARRRLGIPGGQPYFGYVGTIFPRDCSLLFRAHERIRQSLPNATTVLIGNSRLPASIRLPEGVVRTGTLSHSAVLDWTAACDLLLLPLNDSVANRGRWPSKILEYMALCRGIVATDVGDLRQVFQNCAGVRFTPADAESFADGVCRFFGDPHRETASRASRAYLETNLSWRALSPHLDDFFRKVMPTTMPGASAVSAGEARIYE